MDKNLKIFPIQSNKNVKKLGSGKWLDLEEVEYTDPNNVKRTWEFCRRKKEIENDENDKNADVDGNNNNSEDVDDVDD